MTVDNQDPANQGAGANQDDKNQSTVKLEEEMTPEELAVQKESEEFLLDFKEEDFEDEEKKAKLEEALKNAKTTIAQKRHYRDKFNEAVKPGKSGKPEAVKTAPAAPAAEVDDTPQLVLEFRQDNPWASKEVATEVVRQAKLNKETIEQTVKRPMIASWLKKEKDSRDVEEASVAPSRKAGGGSGAEDRDWSNATPEEMEKQRQKILARGRN